MKNADFVINGVSGIEDLHTRMQTKPVITMPKSDKSFQSLSDSDSQIVVNEHSYSGRTIQLTLLVEASNKKERSYRLSKLYEAFDAENYLDFNYYEEPEYTYKVINAEAVEQERASRLSYFTTVKMKLNALPYKYLNEKQSMDVDKETSFFNFQPYNSRPLILVTGQTSLSFTINDRTYKFQNLNTDGTYIDCAESQQAVYSVNNDLIYNAYDLTQGFPEFKKGLNTVTGTGMKIYPRWRTM